VLVAAALVRGEAENERELDHRSLRALTLAMLDCYRSLTGSVFPSDPHEQLAAAAAAVFRSWDAPKAASYRRLNGISNDAGTAVAVQTMVYGNAGGESGAGVAFTRNPANGARELYFDFQFNAQGEDVVAGRHRMRDNERLRLVLPSVWARLADICHELEALFGDAQDFEFIVHTAQAPRLWNWYRSMASVSKRRTCLRMRCSHATCAISAQSLDTPGSRAHPTKAAGGDERRGWPRRATRGCAAA
jgi:pyruvate, orthophosphate dikinase